MGRSPEIQQISAHPHAGNFPALENSTAYILHLHNQDICVSMSNLLSEIKILILQICALFPLPLRQPIHGSPKKIQIYPTQQNYPVQAFQNSGHNLSVSASPVQSHRTTSHYSQSHTVVSALFHPL